MEQYVSAIYEVIRQFPFAIRYWEIGSRTLDREIPIASCDISLNYCNSRAKGTSQLVIPACETHCSVVSRHANLVAPFYKLGGVREIPVGVF